MPQLQIYGYLKIHTTLFNHLFTLQKQNYLEKVPNVRLRLVNKLCINSPKQIFALLPHCTVIADKQEANSPSEGQVFAENEYL